MGEIESWTFISALALSGGMALVPVVMAVFAFRLWRATAMPGSLPLLLGLAGTCLTRLVSWILQWEIQNVMENDGAGVPQWYPIVAQGVGFLMFVAQIITLVGFVTVCEYVIRTHRTRST